MRLLLIEESADGLLDLAIRAKALGHDCRYHVGSYDPANHPTGKGLVERVADWRAAPNWPDLVVAGGNGKYVRDLDLMRARGVPVIGANAEAVKLELDRTVGMAAFKKAGIPTPPFRQCRTLDEAIEYVTKQDRPFACKPCGAVGDKSLSFVGKTPEDTIWRLQRWKRSGKRFPDGLMIQERIKGIEFAAGAWFGPGGFVEGIEENFETKRFMAGDLGPNTGEMGCYSADTEVLTRDGWKFWPEVDGDDELATLVADELAYEKPSALVVYDVNCNMIGWKNQSVDVLVTPNHNMFVASQWTARQEGDDQYGFRKAEDCTQSQYAIRRTAKWAGAAREPMVFPVKHGRPEITVEALAWARFLGVYIAEGSTGGGSVHIAASHPEKSQKVGEIIDATGLAFTFGDRGYRVSSARIARHMRVFGRSWEKFVPAYIKDADPEVIGAFLEGYALGDGSLQPNGFRIFYTSSKRLADDVQELLLKIGRLGLIKCRNRAGIRSLINGRPIHTRRPAYEVIERVQKLRSWLDSRDRYEAGYVGKVYCAEVANHTLFVRRNGKPMWCGNTVTRLVRSSKLFDQVLAPVEGQLSRLGYVGNIDVNCIVDEDGTPYPLEWTVRLGWPAFNIELALHQSDPVEFLACVASGEKPPARTLNEVAVGVVLAIPPFPFGHEKTDEVANVPIWGVTPRIEGDLHFCDAMAGKDQYHFATAGSYVLVATGTGDSVLGARKIAHRVLDRLSVPASPFWRNDIGLRLKRQLPELQRHGYAKGLAYS